MTQVQPNFLTLEDCRKAYQELTGIMRDMESNYRLMHRRQLVLYNLLLKLEIDQNEKPNEHVHPDAEHEINEPLDPLEPIISVLRDANEPLDLKEIYVALQRNHPDFFPIHIINERIYLQRRLRTAVEKNLVIESNRNNRTGTKIYQINAYNI